MAVFKSGSVALACVLGVAVSAQACADEAAAAAANMTVKPYPQGINCVWRPSLRNGYYTVIDDSHMVLEGTGKKFYLLSFGRYCRDLDTGFQLGVDASGGQLCGPGDAIVTDHDRCMIQYLEPVASTSEAKAIVKARDAARRQAGR